jgi:xanthine dehydrogenase iron-sulfur cluster and FAD-binding subunit A
MEKACQKEKGTKMWNRYVNASSIDEVLNLLSANPGKAKLIAGGTDLMLEIEKGIYPHNEIVVDISRIAGLDEISSDSDGTIHLGPMVTHNHVVKSEIIHKYAPLLAEACYSVGSPQIRNRGTIAGNLVTASPANDTISPLMALDAQLTLQSKTGKRVVKLSDFYTGVRRTILQPDEMVVDIAFTGLKDNQKSTFTKYALRKAQAISLVNTSIIIDLEVRKIQKTSITLGAVAPVIIHAQKTEAFLTGKEFSASLLTEAAEKVKEDVSPISDIRSSADYRTQIAAIIVRRGLEKLVEDNAHTSVPADPVVLWGKTAPNHAKLVSKREYSDEKTDIRTRINGKEFVFSSGAHKSLLHLLRDEAGLVGTKEGCGEGECGACTAYLDGVAVMSCLVPAARADGAEIVTIEGISGKGELHPVQEEFIKEGAVQCGYCTPGFIMSAVKLFEEKQTPDLDEIKMAITGNLCRCTGYYKIVKAIENVAERGI